MLFSAPAFLWGLLAVAVPVAVHLLNLRRHRKVYFSNVDRLAEMQARNRQRSRLRQWLVLAMRVLAVVFLVLAFARPVAGGGKSASTTEAVVSVYLDNTFSMDAASEEGSRLDDARRKAREIAAAYGHGTRFQLLTADLAGSQMRWLNRDEFLSAVDEVQPTAASPMLSEASGRMLGFMQRNGAPARHAYIVSDFQRSSSDFHALPPDSLALVTLVPLGASNTDNIYIDTLQLDAPAYFAGGTVEATATLRNSGGRDAEKVPVKLVAGGRDRAVATVDIPAKGSAKAVMRFTLDSEGWTDGWVETTDHPITFDDRYHFSIATGDKIRVLELDRQAADEGLRKLFEADPAVDYRHCKAADFSFTPEYDLVIINGLSDMASGEAGQLAAWVADGGCLLVVPPAGQAGKGSQPPLGELLKGLGIPPLGRWVERKTQAIRVDYGDGLYRGVFSGRSEEMEMPAVLGHYTFENQAERTPIISLADGGDLLVSATCGRGRVYLFTTPLGGEWTDFASQALFVPTVYNMALYSRPLPAAFHTLGDSDPIELQSVVTGSGQPPALTGEGGVSFLPDLRHIGGRDCLLLHGELAADGIYRLAGEHLAFNYPRRESVMEFYERDEVAQATAGLRGYTVAARPAKPLTGEIEARDGGRQLWWLCLALALLALAAETLLLAKK